MGNSRDLQNHKNIVQQSYHLQFLKEIVQSSGLYPITNLLLEMMKDGPINFFTSIDPWIILGAALYQAYFVLEWKNESKLKRFFSFLIGPLIYTLVEGIIEKKTFIYSLNHQAYWIFSLILGILFILKDSKSSIFTNLIKVLEGVFKTMMPFSMYLIFEIYEQPNMLSSLKNFFSDEGHVFIFLIGGVLGISSGLANITSDHYLEIVLSVTEQLKKYSRWLLGEDLLERLIKNPNEVPFYKTTRTVLFMDIRGFTHWSEKKLPEEVVLLLTQYYQLAELVLNQFKTVKIKYSADEIMVVFQKTEDAIKAAIEIQKMISVLLSNQNLGAGIGIHHGVLTEGLIGAMNVRFYDVIGDTVNTAKRIEGFAKKSEILISLNSIEKGSVFKYGHSREVNAKGKEESLVVVPVEFDLK